MLGLFILHFLLTRSLIITTIVLTTLIIINTIPIVIDITKENETGHREIDPPLDRKDEVAFIFPIVSTIYPIPPVKAYFDLLTKCFKCYADRYAIQFDGPIYNDVFKIHKVGKSEGYHAWHYETDEPQYSRRILAWMTYLKVPEKGGETEFLYQSKRIEPVVGKTLIWPAHFTHLHRGNPPLKGEKYYITGWFER